MAKEKHISRGIVTALRPLVLCGACGLLLAVVLVSLPVVTKALGIRDLSLLARSTRAFHWSDEPSEMSRFGPAARSSFGWTYRETLPRPSEVSQYGPRLPDVRVVETVGFPFPVCRWQVTIPGGFGQSELAITGLVSARRSAPSAIFGSSRAERWLDMPLRPSEVSWTNMLINTAVCSALCLVVANAYLLLRSLWRSVAGRCIRCGHFVPCVSDLCCPACDRAHCPECGSIVGHRLPPRR